MIKKIFLSVVLLLVAFTITSSDAGAISSSSYCMEDEELTFLSLINDYRKSKGLVALKATKTLGAAAEHHSIDMATYNYFSHSLSGPDHRIGTADDISWSTNIRNHGYPSGYTMGENILAGRQSADGALSLWKTSPAHNDNMLNTAWKAIGIGRVYKAGSQYEYYWTTTFASFVDTSAPPSCSGEPTPTPEPDTPTNYVRLPYSLDELSAGSTVNQWKNTLVYIKKSINLNQIGFYNTGANAKYEVRNSESSGSIGTVVSSGSLKSSPNSSNYYYQDTNINLSGGKYYVIRIYPTTSKYYFGSSSTYYTELSFLRRSNGSNKASTTGAFQLRLRFTLR